MERSTSFRSGRNATVSASNRLTLPTLALPTSAMPTLFMRRRPSKLDTLAAIALGMTLSFKGCAPGPELPSPSSPSPSKASTADPEPVTARTATDTSAAAGAESANPEAGWTEPVPVGDEFEPCVSYRARIEGEYLVIEAKHRTGWHSYALDNEVRAAAKLAGAESLGVELPTSFKVQGATVVGTWLQTPPEDLSDTEIQWYTFGFNGTAVFAAKLKDVGTKPVGIAVRGQVCDANGCRDVDLELRLDPAANRIQHAPDIGALIPEQKAAKKKKRP